MADIENAESIEEMENAESIEESVEENAEGSAGFWFPWWLLRVSGLYIRTDEELRLDVDGRYPQMTASGTIRSGIAAATHWIANLSAAATNTWSGPIWFKDGLALPFTNVEIKVVRSLFPSFRSATVTLSGGGGPSRTRTFSWKSRYFHEVEFEYDTAAGTTAVTSIGTCDHPNRPSLPCQNLTINTVYRRAGFRVSNSGGNGGVPLAIAGPNALWSDMEMHDAMQTFWSRFDNRAQWSMWVFFAARHEMGSGLGGIMFDDIGPNHRQGTAIFNDTFIANAPAGDPAPAAWVRRMKFWTACHEMGHAFNLAHSWQKALVGFGNPWIPLANEPLARSFMNYPFRVPGGQIAFFSDFEYRFSDQELLFMRHAPARFVQMGNADWFEDHGFQQAAVSAEPKFRLELRVHRDLSYFEFLEPVKIEAKLTNISEDPQVVSATVLSESDAMTVILKKAGKPARRWAPYAQRCYKSGKEVLRPGESKYDSLNVAAGLNGWDIAEPGVYQIQAALHLGEEDIVSKALRVRVAPPANSYAEELLAQDFFSEDVGRTLAVGGTRYLDGANATLEKVASELSGRRVAYHARFALGNPSTRDYKRLAVSAGTRACSSVWDDGGKIEVINAKQEEAKRELTAALMENAAAAAETLGHIDYKSHVDGLTDFLAARGDTEGAEACQGDLHSTLLARKVSALVLSYIEQRRKDVSQPAARGAEAGG